MIIGTCAWHGACNVMGVEDTMDARTRDKLVALGLQQFTVEQLQRVLDAEDFLLNGDIHVVGQGY